MIIGIIGLGFVGNAMQESFTLKGVQDIKVYDKFKNGGIGKLEDCLSCNILFLALPTIYDESSGCYDREPIIETCNYLIHNNFNGAVVVKSTIEPETLNELAIEFNTLHFIHNPEFLTAINAFDDFHNQSHIVLGQGTNCSDKNLNNVISFYKKYYQNADISTCSTIESESMKSFVNCFYAVKVQFFTEIYLLCQKNNCDFNKVRKMMLKNDWIHPNHTQIPGPDGDISYGGLCFPKDTNALTKYMERKNSPNQVLNATIKERNSMRSDNLNCSKK